MSDPTVSERRIRPIQDAVAIGNFKQALKECEKWQKKGEKSDKFLALKAFILTNQPDSNQLERGQAEVLQLCHRNPAVTDVDAIHLLENALKHLEIQADETLKLWERAAAARPADQALLMTWLHGSIAESNWLGAQKAAMALRKAFPKDRQYDFWNILMYFLVSNDASVPEKDRKLYGSLAYRLISKAAEAVPMNPEHLLNPGKVVSTPEEVCLLAQIYMDTGHASEAVDLLQGPSLNPESQVGQQDPQQVNALLFEALEASQRWTDAFFVCRTMLEKPEHRGDDRVWNLLYKAGSDPQIQDDYTEFIKERWTMPELHERLALLTRLKTLLDSGKGKSISYSDVFTLCTQYYRSYRDKSFCFDDLRPSLDGLDVKHRDEFRTFLDTESLSHPNTSDQLFRLKYNRLTSSADEDSPSILSRATAGLQLYQASTPPTKACPEASLIAALDTLLLATSSLQDRTKFIFRATLLLELSHAKFPDYYPYSILLIQCYTHLGLLSLAMETFAKLSIKNLQWENVGHLLLNRISTLHPFPYNKDNSKTRTAKDADDDESLDPRGALEAGLAVLKRSRDALNQGVREGLEEGSYSNILDCVNVKRDLERSLNLWVYKVEEGKIKRLMGEFTSAATADAGVGAGLGVRRKEAVDMRDYSFLNKYISRDEGVHDILRRGVHVDEAWVDAMVFVDALIAFLKIEAIPGEKELEKSKLPELVEMAGPEDRIKAGVTGDEFRVYHAAMAVWGVVKSVMRGSGQEKDKEEVAESMEKIKVVLHAVNEKGFEGGWRSVNGVKVPGREYLHASFVAWELVCLISTFVTWLLRQQQGKAKGKKAPAAATRADIKEEVEVLKQGLVKLEEGIRETARKVKKGLTEGGVLGELVDVVLARNEQQGSGWKEWSEGMEAVFGGDEAVVETVVGRWMESWDDAVDGILGVKVKLGR